MCNSSTCPNNKTEVGLDFMCNCKKAMTLKQLAENESASIHEFAEVCEWIQEVYPGQDLWEVEFVLNEEEEK